ncbi:hypothetical protein GCM10028807_32880 [Spirosoma daeguense]
MEYLNKLTDLQKTIGYVPGEVHPVAMLGLMGECGEVANECNFIPASDLRDVLREQAQDDITAFSQDVDKFIEAALEIDGIKKELRQSDGIRERRSIAVACNDKGNSFNLELADCFYYLNAIAIGRGLTIDELARISYEKVMQKRATIGPEMQGN